MTGLSPEIADDISGKWLELLREAVPRLSSVAVISNPDSSFVPKIRKHHGASAPKLGLRLRFIDVSNIAKLDRALAKAKLDIQAMSVLPDPITIHRRRQIAALAASLATCKPLTQHVSASQGVILGAVGALITLVEPKEEMT